MSGKSSSFLKLPGERIITLSTSITLVRIALVPFVVRSILAQSWGYVLILFGIAAITDVLDGALARLRNEKTFFGACLDPIADKFLLLSCFTALSCLEQTEAVIPVWFVWLVLGKELLLVGSIVLLHLRDGAVTIAPTMLGKLTTVIQIFFVMVLVASYFYSIKLASFYTLLLYGTSSMTVASYLHYVVIWHKQRQNLKKRIIL